MMSVRATSIAFVFGALLGLVGILARAHAVEVNTPWFGPAATLQVYSVSLLAATLTTLGLALFASSRAGRFDDALRTYELRVAALYGHRGLALLRHRDRVDPDEEDLYEEEFAQPEEYDTRLRPYEDIDAAWGLVRRRFREAANSQPVTPQGPRQRRLQEVQEVLLRQRDALQAVRDQVWPTLAGPLTGAVLMTAISGIMLPGSGGFAQTHFQLNTTFILFLGYGWWVLLAWVVASIASIPSVTGPKRVFRPRLWERAKPEASDRSLFQEW